MSVNLDESEEYYYQKYLKYKIKYLELKSQIGGTECPTMCKGTKSGVHEWSDNKKPITCKHCGCHKKDTSVKPKPKQKSKK